MRSTTVMDLVLIEGSEHLVLTMEKPNLTLQVPAIQQITPFIGYADMAFLQLNHFHSSNIFLIQRQY